MDDTSKLGPQRHQISVGKYENGRTPEDGPPDTVDCVTIWTDPDGTQITDEERIAALEAEIQEG